MADVDNKQHPSSPYKIGNWTVTKLREELKSRKAPTTGNKEELVERLEKLGERTPSNCHSSKKNHFASFEFHENNRVEGRVEESWIVSFG